MKNCKEDVWVLVERNLALANKLAIQKKKNSPPRISFDELQSAAYMGLVEAATRFDATRGFCFTTYAYPRISGAMNDYLRELGSSMISLDTDRDDASSLKEICVSKQNNGEYIFELAEKDLGKKAASMLKSYYVGNYSMKEIGEQHGITEGRVSQLFAYYREHLRNSTYKLAC